MDPAVFGYIRVSQAEGESGLATQRRILTEHGLRDDRIYTDVASGRTMRRPAWKQLPLGPESHAGARLRHLGVDRP